MAEVAETKGKNGREGWRRVRREHETFARIARPPPARGADGDDTRLHHARREVDDQSFDLALVAGLHVIRDQVDVPVVNITHRTTRPSVWHDVFHKYGGYALVELGDGRLVFGWVEFYSDFPSPPSLFLENACWVEPETGSRRQVDGPGILITGEIKTISFHHAKDTSQLKREASESAHAS